jgi:REP element-mobilizing transposase RayT
MALSAEISTAVILRHIVARSYGRRTLFPDASARAKAARRIAECCARHRLQCVVWCVTDRFLHLVVRGAPGTITLATDELAATRLRHGLYQSTKVNTDIYLLEVARHALLAPVRGGLVRRVIDWPHSSARELLGLSASPSWLDPTPLYDLLGPRDGRGSERFRRFMDSN